MHRLALIPCLALSLSACGGGTIEQLQTKPSFELISQNTLSNNNPPTSILSYEVMNNDQPGAGYVITNSPDDWEVGQYERIVISNVDEIKRLRNYSGGSDQIPDGAYVGLVTYDNIQYDFMIFTDPDNQNVEVLSVVPTSISTDGWNYGEDLPLPDGVVIRAIGMSPAPVNVKGIATYTGVLMMYGGDGTAAVKAEFNVDFDNDTAVFQTPRWHLGGKIYADVEIDSSTGQFSSSNVIKSFSDNIYQPELAYGEMNGNFSGGDQSGAIGAIWSKPSEDQFVGAFALTRDD